MLLTLHLGRVLAVPPLARVPRPLLRREFVHLADHLLAALVADRQQVQQELLRQEFADLFRNVQVSVKPAHLSIASDYTLYICSIGIN